MLSESTVEIMVKPFERGNQALFLMIGIKHEQNLAVASSKFQNLVLSDVEMMVL